VDTIHDEGWVLVWRKLIESQVFQNEGLLKVFIWCILKANFKDTWIPIRTGRGTTEVFVKRGQFIFGRKTASKELKMKQGTLYDRMQKLADMQNINIQPNTHFSIITVCNYGPYQFDKTVEPTSNPTPKQHPSNTDKELIKKKTIGRSPQKETDPRVKEFLSFWGETFLQVTGQPYVFSFGKDGSLAKDLLKVHSFEILQGATRDYFRDERCRAQGFTFGRFKVEVNRLLSQKAMDPLAQAKREQVR